VEAALTDVLALNLTFLLKLIPIFFAWAIWRWLDDALRSWFARRRLAARVRAMPVGLRSEVCRDGEDKMTVTQIDERAGFVRLEDEYFMEWVPFEQWAAAPRRIRRPTPGPVTRAR
jgi:hypothetical protein